MKTTILILLLVVFSRHAEPAAITFNLYGKMSDSKIVVNMAKSQTVYYYGDGADNAIVNRETAAAARSYDELMTMYRDIVCERPWDRRAETMKCMGNREYYYYCIE